jgi:hypothetical protein
MLTILFKLLFIIYQIINKILSNLPESNQRQFEIYTRLHLALHLQSNTLPTELRLDPIYYNTLSLSSFNNILFIGKLTWVLKFANY